MSVYINYIGTANPKHKIAQTQIAKFMANAQEMDAEEQRKLEVLYRASAIQTRYSVLADYEKQTANEYQFYPRSNNLEPFPTVGQRMQIYQKEALPLCIAAIKDTFPDHYNYSQITHLVTVSCTGMYAPGIDIEIIQALGLPTSTQRTAINFMGCYAAFNAIKTANQIVRSNPDALVLIVAVELCSLHFQKKKDTDTLLANTLFGDGAGALLISGKQGRGFNLRLDHFYCDLAIQGKQEMAWSINDFGFEMKLTAMVPEFIRFGIKELTDRLLAKLNLSVSDVDYFAIHPGGKKILRVIEEELEIERSANRFAHEVLRNHGNMSSPTIIFVLKNLLAQLSKENQGKNILSFAFGPGLTLESMLLTIVHRDY
ncbi:MAG: type III polyketide synthase [Bacteroidota bacterium]